MYNFVIDTTEIEINEDDADFAVASARSVSVVAVPVKSEFWYALVNKETGKRAIPSRCNNNRIGLYRNRIGPSQLAVHRNLEKYEIIKYEVLLKSVGH